MRRQRGFTYLGLLILVAIIGLVGAASLKVGSLLQRAAAEEELLEIGAQFSQALKSYADATPQGHPRFPATLNELLRDPRVPGVRRHLRKIFVDPVTGKAEWGLITMGENAGVLGVYSLSDAEPLKQANFDTRFTNFENKKKISEWKFMMPGQALMEGGVQQNGAPPSLFGGQRPGQPPGQPLGQAPGQPFGRPVQPGQAPVPPLPGQPTQPQPPIPAEPAPPREVPQEAPPPPPVEEQPQLENRPVDESNRGETTEGDKNGDGTDDDKSDDNKTDGVRDRRAR